MSKRKVLSIYLVVGFLWVVSSDYLLQLFHENIAFFAKVQKIKGILFVVLTGSFIYWLLNKKEKLEEIKEEKEKLLTLINSMEDFVNFKDGNGRWIEVNNFGLKLFQLENVDYKGKKDSELANYTVFYKDALNACEESDELTWKAGTVTRIEEKFPMVNGKFKTFDTIKVPLFHEDGSRKALVVMGRDITEKIKAKQKLEESEQRYKSLFEYNPELVYMVDKERRYQRINGKVKDLTGYSQEEFYGGKLGTIVVEKHKEKVKKAFYSIMDTGELWHDEEVEIQRKDGKIITLLCSAVPMIINEEVVGIIGYGKDITQLKETEEKLRKSEKLSVVGELAASVAHEIRNPLTSLMGFTQMLRSEDEKHDTYYKIMFDEFERINQIVSELLMLAKPQNIDFKWSDVKEVMNGVVSLLDSQANLYGAELRFNVDERIPLIKCEPNQLKQLFINVIKNSIEASAKTIDIRIKEHDEDHVLISVEDDGCGIEEERLKRLGEPFYSVKEKGTGLGLTVSYRIVESHKGKINIHSNKNKGTTVDILLPQKVR